MVRLRGCSDLNVFSSIFVLQEYSRLQRLDNVLLVLDLGANVGYSSAYFLSHFPDSRVIAVEPDERNAEICRMNLKLYGERALILHGAAWSECTKLCLSKDTCGVGLEWTRQVVRPCDNSAGYVEAWDVGTLIDKSRAGIVDLLKVDIERSELAVFGENARQWLPRVRNICIELHGEDCKDIFFHAMADFDYKLEYYDLLTICTNIRLKTFSL
jgi:FkbM family methyltransferase